MVLKKKNKSSFKPVCPQCDSVRVIPVVYGFPDAKIDKELRLGRAIISSREDWEGHSQWHCSECECEWRGSWIKFKVS